MLSRAAWWAARRPTSAAAAARLRGVHSSKPRASSALERQEPAASPQVVQLDAEGFAVIGKSLPRDRGVDFRQELDPNHAETIELEIDGQTVQVQKGGTLIQACEQVGIQVPRFCYHERLSVAGNCRMCLVEVEKAPKPVAACAMPAAPGMKVFTDSAIVKKAREGVMEFLLVNHPLDCPICDQGGECDLQDQAMNFGADRGRTLETRRVVEDKNLGPLVKTVMTRCIHCTRCVRFATEVAGVSDIGTVGRGNAMEIGTYVEKTLKTELSGNVADLCPVGALTSKPYAFTARPWELRSVESIDVLDGLCANIRVDTRGGEVMRVLPRLNEDINEEWITDKTRFSFDGLKLQRLDAPYIRPGPDMALEPASWQEALAVVAERLGSVKPARIGAFVGNLVDAEAMVALKDLMASLGAPGVFCDVPYGMPTDCRAAYTFGPTLAGAEDADAVLLVGTNLRWEAPLLNARLRRGAVDRNVPVAAIGPAVDLTYPVQHLGDSPQPLADLAAGKHPFLETLKAAKRPMVVVGTGAFDRPDAEGVSAALRRLVAQVPGLLQEGWNGLGTLQTSAAAVGALDLGLKPAPLLGDASGATQPYDVLYLLGYDSFDIESVAPDAFVVYQGHHGDVGAEIADVVLPGSAFTEKVGTYANTEGRVQRTARAVSPPGEARVDWAIIRALSEVAGKPLPYDDADGVRDRLAAVAPQLADDSEGLEPVDHEAVRAALAKGADGKVPLDASKPFRSPIHNFYMTDCITRASPTMASCTETFLGKQG